MVALLSFIGIVAILIILKFIYDTFLSNKTETEWSKYKSENPENAARIERNKGLNINTRPKPNSIDKEVNLSIIADHFNCPKKDAKKMYFKNLLKEKTTAKTAKFLIKEFKTSKYDQATRSNIDPEDTKAAFFETWTKEYVERKIYANRKRTNKEIIEDLGSEFKGFEEAINSPNKSDVKNFLKNNFEVNKILLEEIEYANKPAEKILMKAREIAGEKENFNEAIKLIDEALDIGEIKIEPFLYEFRSDCNKELGNYQDAINDISKAISLINKSRPSEYDLIYDFLMKRSEIKKDIGDLEGYNSDKEEAEKYDDGIPF